ncbi:MAG: hypothetical protein V1909_05800 [Candidatus Micrarchaeota archaeon]
MRPISANEVIGYFWIILIFAFAGLLWWKVSSILYTDEVCILQAGFLCKEKRLYFEGGELKLELTAKNKLGRWVQITGVMCSSEVPDPAIGRPKREFEELKINAIPDSDFKVSGKCYRGDSDKATESFKGIIYIRYEFKDEPFTPGSQVVLGNMRGSVG